MGAIVDAVFVHTSSAISVGYTDVLTLYNYYILIQSEHLKTVGLSVALSALSEDQARVFLIDFLVFIGGR